LLLPQHQDCWYMLHQPQLSDCTMHHRLLEN